jgi:hypothetical protein
MNEPAITVNGQPLTEGQAMAVRVAISVYCMEMDEKGALGDDEHGIAMAAAYKDRLTEVLRMMKP